MRCIAYTLLCQRRRKREGKSEKWEKVRVAVRVKVAVEILDKSQLGVEEEGFLGQERRNEKSKSKSKSKRRKIHVHSISWASTEQSKSQFILIFMSMQLWYRYRLEEPFFTAAFASTIQLQHLDRQSQCSDKRPVHQAWGTRRGPPLKQPWHRHRLHWPNVKCQFRCFVASWLGHVAMWPLPSQEARRKSSLCVCVSLAWQMDKIEWEGLKSIIRGQKRCKRGGGGGVMLKAY